MEYLRQTFSGSELNKIFALPPELRNRRVEVIVLPADSIEEPKGNSCKIGCCPDLPPLPDSFFEPLPEEDLQAWGL